MEKKRKLKQFFTENYEDIKDDVLYKTEEEAVQHNPLGSTIIQVPKKGFRRVVPSPIPLSLLCMEGVKEAVKKHKVVVCGGGGGIPTIIEDDKYITLSWFSLLK